jgi:hypothetical protein
MRRQSVLLETAKGMCLCCRLMTRARAARAWVTMLKLWTMETLLWRGVPNRLDSGKGIHGI